MIDMAAHTFLSLGKITCIVPIIIFGIIFHKRETYEVAACFLCFVMVFNWILKYFFKVPLFPHLGSGYAFPSGHMHASAIFYGYILCKTGNYTVKTLLAFLIAGIGFALVHCNYHDWFDVLGAMIFAAMEITIYFLLEISPKIKAISVTLFMGIMLCVIHYFYKMEPHIWLAFYSFVGFLAGMKFSAKTTLIELRQKIFALLGSVVFMGVVYWIS
ncbi:MAG: hypothetical protein LBJ71_04095, partial [Holosporaceae bacterium]|nr:hypothetical protein [Holosporaceae bacterium]